MTRVLPRPVRVKSVYAGPSDTHAPDGQSVGGRVWGGACWPLVMSLCREQVVARGTRLLPRAQPRPLPPIRVSEAAAGTSQKQSLEDI